MIYGNSPGVLLGFIDATNINAGGQGIDSEIKQGHTYNIIN